MSTEVVKRGFSRGKSLLGSVELEPKVIITYVISAQWFLLFHLLSILLFVQ
jgi:hypothetical protein